MKILVTGANGQLGRETVLILRASSHDVVALTRQELDLSKTDQIAECIASHRADWVINCAAYTQVDKAESEPELASLVNRDAAQAVAEGVHSYGGKLLHVSTDYVFDGTQSHAYSESDTTHPLGIYGKTKLEGEQATLKLMPDAIILRTAWVYGIHGHNFVKTILRLIAERDELSVVDDQIGTPSWTADIAQAMLALIEKEAKGIFHFTDEGVTSWFDFAVAIRETGKNQGFPIKAAKICPIPSKNYPTPAPRPAFTVLSKEKIRGILGYDIPHWQDSLQSMLKKLKDSTLI
ncbi:MAG: dTDP-4-dehydrorhamnose reductase [Kangiella sp.]|nr:dTDP-4-dehydrorhamnose reductase [Kangiella sp.]